MAASDYFAANTRVKPTGSSEPASSSQLELHLTASPLLEMTDAAPDWLIATAQSVDRAAALLNHWKVSVLTVGFGSAERALSPKSFRAWAMDSAQSLIGTELPDAIRAYLVDHWADPTDLNWGDWFLALSEAKVLDIRSASAKQLLDCVSKPLTDAEQLRSYERIAARAQRAAAQVKTRRTRPVILRSEQFHDLAKERLPEAGEFERLRRQRSITAALQSEHQKLRETVSTSFSIDEVLHVEFVPATSFPLESHGYACELNGSISISELALLNEEVATLIKRCAKPMVAHRLAMAMMMNITASLNDRTQTISKYLWLEARRLDRTIIERLRVIHTGHYRYPIASAAVLSCHCTELHLVPEPEAKAGTDRLCMDCGMFLVPATESQIGDVFPGFGRHPVT